jgi:hypothetical protein
MVMRLRNILKLFLCLAALQLAAHAQYVMPAQLSYSWTVPTGNAGQVGQYIVFDSMKVARPGQYTIDVTITGTTPATCTFRVEGSADAATWYGLDVTSPSTTSCTTSYMESIVNRPVLFLRIYVTYTQGDTTTKAVFHYKGGRS